ncbi:hypothetical protein D3C78_1059570 [compost metagenome]
MITPAPALDPYNAAAAAPFNTLIDSISSGLMFEIPSPKSAPPYCPAEPSVLAAPVIMALPELLLFIGTPFNTYNGCDEPVNEEDPLIITLAAPPGPEAGVATLTPATFPAKAFATLTSRACVNSSPFT